MLVTIFEYIFKCIYTCSKMPKKYEEHRTSKFETPKKK